MESTEGSQLASKKRSRLDMGSTEGSKLASKKRSKFEEALRGKTFQETQQAMK